MDGESPNEDYIRHMTAHDSTRSSVCTTAGHHSAHTAVVFATIVTINSSALLLRHVDCHKEWRVACHVSQDCCHSIVMAICGASWHHPSGSLWQMKHLLSGPYKGYCCLPRDRASPNDPSKFQIIRYSSAENFLWHLLPANDQA